MSDVAWDKLFTLVIAVTILICVTILASVGVAPWDDTYTLYLIVLAGAGFAVGGYYAGKERAYREAGGK